MRCAVPAFTHFSYLAVLQTHSKRQAGADFILGGIILGEISYFYLFS
jgi:hypothetical protein